MDQKGCQAVEADMEKWLRGAFSSCLSTAAMSKPRDAGTPPSPILVAGLFGFRLSHINTRPSWEENSSETTRAGLKAFILGRTSSRNGNTNRYHLQLVCVKKEPRQFASASRILLGHRR